MVLITRRKWITSLLIDEVNKSPTQYTETNVGYELGYWEPRCINHNPVVPSLEHIRLSVVVAEEPSTI